MIEPNDIETINTWLAKAKERDLLRKLWAIPEYLGHEVYQSGYTFKVYETPRLFIRSRKYNVFWNEKADCWEVAFTISVYVTRVGTSTTQHQVGFLQAEYTSNNSPKLTEFKDQNFYIPGFWDDEIESLYTKAEYRRSQLIEAEVSKSEAWMEKVIQTAKELNIDK